MYKCMLYMNTVIIVYFHLSCLYMHLFTLRRSATSPKNRLDFNDFDRICTVKVHCASLISSFNPSGFCSTPQQNIDLSYLHKLGSEGYEFYSAAVVWSVFLFMGLKVHANLCYKVKGAFICFFFFDFKRCIKFKKK